MSEHDDEFNDELNDELTRREEQRLTAFGYARAAYTEAEAVRDALDRLPPHADYSGLIEALATSVMKLAEALLWLEQALPNDDK